MLARICQSIHEKDSIEGGYSCEDEVNCHYGHRRNGG
jgi:hypothetical protein